MRRKELSIGIIVVSILLFGRQTTPADNWARFRGPNGSGVAHDKDIPVQFSAGKGILWKVPIPGLGNSSPVVWGNSLFLQSATANGNKRLLLCLDARTGQTIWSQTIPGVKAHTHVKNTLASSTPATDGEIVVVSFWDGQEVFLTAYDFKGRLLWQRNLGSFTSQHGTGASPIFFQDKVFLANDQDGKSVLYAFHKKTGEILWEAPREAYRTCYSAPFLRERPGAAPELVVVSTTSIRGYDPDTGKANWSWNWEFTAKMPLRTTGSPIFAQDTIYACSGDGGGDRHMVAVRLEDNGGKTRPQLAWENKKDFPYVPTTLSRGEHLYFVNDKGFAACFLAKTGRQTWYVRQPDATFTSSPVLIDGKMYAASEEGEVYVFAAEPSYRLLAKNTIGERVRATPAVANNRLYLRGQHHLFCIGKETMAHSQ